MTSPTIHELGEQLGIALHDPDAIRQAFTHASFANENPGLVAATTTPRVLGTRCWSHRQPFAVWTLSRGR